MNDVFGISRDDVISEILAIAQNEWKIDTSGVTAETRLADLPGLDVAKHVEAVALLERNYDITFPDDDTLPAETVGGFADQVMAGLADRADG